MKVRVLTFAGVREILGAGEITIELPAGAGIAELRSALESDHPALESYWDRLAVAVDGKLGEDAPRLRDGSEVALLPPVSGGTDAQELLTDGPIDVPAVARRVAARGRGAVLTFEGRVRDRHHGREVTHLIYDAYRSMAEASLRRIIDEIEAESRELSLAIVHRLGRVAAGEASVVIAVASPHRDAAYRASREALERLKREVPIWKNEHYADGSSRWREEEPLAPVAASLPPE
jgi:molybdopterin synthase catalytic subunit